jgi:hypothetical protein
VYTFRIRGPAKCTQDPAIKVNFDRDLFSQSRHPCPVDRFRSDGNRGWNGPTRLGENKSRSKFTFLTWRVTFLEPMAYPVDWISFIGDSIGGVPSGRGVGLCEKMHLGRSLHFLQGPGYGGWFRHRTQVSLRSVSLHILSRHFQSKDGLVMSVYEMVRPDQPPCRDPH